MSRARLRSIALPGSWRRSLTGVARRLALAIALALGAGAVASAQEAVAGAVLTIESEPAGAEASLDGRALGRTPLAVRDLPDGDHILILSLPGHVVQRRVLRPRPGESGALRVVLAPLSTAVKPTTAPEGKGRKRGILRKPLLLAVPVVAGGVAYVVVNRLRAPEIGMETPQPAGRALVDVTSVSLSVAVKSGGDGLRFDWDFGDGTKSSGTQTVQHVFTQTGELTVTVTAGKSSGGSSSANAAVSVRSLTGDWELVVNARANRTLRLTQSGKQLAGDVLFSDTWEYAAIAGVAENPRRVHLVETFRGGGSLSYDGEADGSLDRITGQASNGDQWELRRRSWLAAPRAITDRKVGRGPAARPAAGARSRHCRPPGCSLVAP